MDDLVHAIRQTCEERLERLPRCRVNLDPDEFVQWTSGHLQTGARRGLVGTTNPRDVAVNVSYVLNRVDTLPVLFMTSSWRIANDPTHDVMIMCCDGVVRPGFVAWLTDFCSLGLLSLDLDLEPRSQQLFGQQPRLQSQAPKAKGAAPLDPSRAGFM